MCQVKFNGFVNAVHYINLLARREQQNFGNLNGMQRFEEISLLATEEKLKIYKSC